MKENRFFKILERKGGLLILGIFLVLLSVLAINNKNKMKERGIYTIARTVEYKYSKGYKKEIYYEFSDSNGKLFEDYFGDIIFNGELDIIIPDGLYLVLYDSLQPMRSVLIYEEQFHQYDSSLIKIYNNEGVQEKHLRAWDM